MHPDNPFNNLDNVPDTTATAIVAVLFWLGLATVPFLFDFGRASWMIAAALSVVAVRVWLRFRSS